jgi:flagellar biosynthesis/type III secretory pathway M-ring protein FliF/YscJ
MNALLDGLKALGVARLAAMAAVALGMLGLFALLALRGGSEPMALLYGDLDLRDSGQVTDQLTRQHIPYRVAGGGTQVLVPADQVAQARVGLAKEGLPSGGSVGYEIFDRSDGLAATEFQQQINQTRALEGELDRTIRAINGVRAVRVPWCCRGANHFARERQDAQASVLLTMNGAARLDREGIQAILNLVAAAVPGLRPKNIAIVDSRGDLLARAGEPTGPTAEALTTEEVRRATETAPVARGRGDAGKEPWPGEGACRGGGAHELRSGQANRGALRSGRTGDAQHAERQYHLEDHRGRRHGHGTEQPAERRCRDKSERATRNPGRRKPPTSRSARRSAR